MCPDPPKAHLVDAPAARNAREIERVLRMPPGRVAELLQVDFNVWRNCRDGIREPRRGLAWLLRSIVESPLFKLRARIVDELEKTDAAVERLCNVKSSERISGAVGRRARA
jgi:hypothetical protein